MVIAVKTRELKRDLDYDWEDYFPSDKSLSVEAGKLHRALEGADVDSRFAVLLRPSNSVGVTLGVSVSTNRNDAVGRPIRTVAVLRAVTSKENDLLVRFFAECLRKEDKETLYDEKSGVAKAVESLYQTKKLDDFMQYCRSLPTVNGGGVKQADRWAIPRDYMTDRSALVESLPALIRDNKPFLLALTDRLPTDVLCSLGSMFDHAVVRIFSEATEKPEKLPEPASQKHCRAAVIGGAVLLVLIVAAIGTCSREGRNGEANSSRGGADDGTSMSTNLQVIGGMVANGVTNAPSQEAAVTNAPSTSRDGSGGYVTPAATNAPLQEVAVTNALLSSQRGLGGPVTSAVTNTLQQKEAVTNSLKTASDGTGKRKQKMSSNSISQLF